MVSGAGTVLIWIYAPITINGQSLSGLLYEIVPGFIVSTLAIVVVSLLTPAPNEKITDTFEKVKAQLS